MSEASLLLKFLLWSRLRMEINIFLLCSMFKRPLLLSCFIKKASSYASLIFLLPVLAPIQPITWLALMGKVVLTGLCLYMAAYTEYYTTIILVTNGALDPSSYN
jgi:hypothetical protein